MIIFSDRASVTKRITTPEGFVVIKDVKIARTGIQLYQAGELLDVPGLPQKFRDNPSAIVRVARLADDIFAPEALASFQNSPMTNNHPGVAVDSTNVKSLQIGFSFGDVRRVGEYVETDLKVQDAAAINDVNSGKVEISNGYDADLEFRDGVLDGQPFDAVMTNIKGNHIALVERGRAGQNVRLSDNHKPKGKKTMAKTVIVDGLAFEFEDQGAQVVEKLQGQVVTLTQQINDAATSHTAALDAEKAAHAKTQGVLEGEKGKHLTDAQIDERVATRAALIGDIKKVLGEEAVIAGKSELELKTAVVAKLNDSIDLAGKDANFVEGVYSTLVATAKSGSASNFADALNKDLDPKPKDESEVDKAQKKLRLDSQNAWKTGATA